MSLVKTNKNSHFFERKIILSLLIIAIISLLIRLYFFDPNIPVALDSSEYFLYGIHVSNLGKLPENFSLDNNGWSIFLSLFFLIFNFDNALSYMQLQKILSIMISVLTIIPIYFLCRKFFEKTYSVLGAAIFAFEPRLIQNSLFGITEPLYIFLIASSLALFLSSSKKFVYVSFFIAGITTIVRSEGLFLFFALSIIFFVRYRKDRLVIPNYIPALIIFVLVLLPMSLYQIEVKGDDRVLTRIVAGLESVNDAGLSFMLRGIENYTKFFGWDLIPIFIVFLPIGTIYLFKELNYRNLTIIISIIALSLPALYAYSIPALDTRFLYVLYPMFCVVSIFTVKKFASKFNYSNFILIGILGIILIASFIFLDYKKIDYEHEIESFAIAEYIVTNTRGINHYYPESKYITSAEIIKRWPNLPLPPSYDIVMIPFIDQQSLEDFIKNSKDLKLSHLVVDSNDNRPKLLLNVFYNEKNYPYLEKQFDSVEHGYNYHVKIFKINYDKLN